MNKSTIIAVIVFAALAAVAFGSLHEKPQRGITRISFASVDPAKVDRIVVQGAQAIELTRDGDTWKAGTQRADGAAVDRLIEAVKRVESGDVVTRNQSRFTELEVDADKGTEVQAFSGGAKVADFVVGSTTGGGSNVRVDDTVYLVKQVYKGAFARDRSQWLDRKLFADAANDATRVEVKLAGHDPYALVKDGDDWKPEDASALPAKFRFDGNAARALVSSLVSAQAKDVLDDDPGDATTGLGDGADTLVFHVAAGDPRTLRIGTKKDDATVYARASTRGEVVTLPEYLAKNLRKPFTDMRDLSLMDLDSSAAKRVEIVNDKDRLVLEKDADTWKVAESSKETPKDFTFDPSAVMRRLTAIGTARALGTTDGDVTPAKTGLDKPAQRVSVTLGDDRVVTLAFGKEAKLGDTEGVYARGNADGETYVVNTFTRNNVLGGLDTFAKREQPASPIANLDPKALSNLPPEVRDSLMKQIQQKRQQDEAMRKIMEKQPKAAAAQ
jgi:Domain of unknown function (DUF4340)